MTLISPTNKIIVQGDPLYDERKIETVANCFPGRLVKKGTADHQIVVNTAAGKACGVLGYEKAHPDYKPKTVDTIYVVNDWAPIRYGGGFVYNGRLKNGESVVMGDLLVAAANGEVKKATAATVTLASGSTAVTSDKAQPDESVAGSIPAEGIIVGEAKATVDASAAAKDLLILSKI